MKKKPSKHAAESVIFVDYNGHDHIAIVTGKGEGTFLDLKYQQDGVILTVEDVPKQTERTIKVCWK